MYVVTESGTCNSDSWDQQEETVPFPRHIHCILSQFCVPVALSCPAGGGHSSH
jgi:hypothetical protein